MCEGKHTVDVGVGVCRELGGQMGLLVGDHKRDSRTINSQLNRIE